MARKCICCDKEDLFLSDESHLTKIGNKSICYRCLEDLKYALDIPDIERKLNDIEYDIPTDDEIKDIALEEINRKLE